jgi:LEA14-like dessication related protein
MRSLLILLGLSLSLLVAGCGTPPEGRLESPALRVTGLEAGMLKLSIINPNTAPLVVSRSTYTLSLGDERIGRIDDRTPIGVPALATLACSVALPAPVAEKVRAYFAKNPGEVRAFVEGSLVIAVGSEDTTTLKAAGGGSVKAP